MLRIKRKRAVKLFKALGFKTAKNWDNSRLQDKLINLPELAEEASLEDPKMKKLLKKVSKAKEILVYEVDNKGNTQTNENVNRKENEVAKKKKSKKKDKKKVATATGKKVKKDKAKKKDKKKDKKKAAKKTVAKNVDKFGAREGSIKAKINAVLSKKSKTMKVLLKEAKVQNPQTGHLNDLIKAGKVKKTDKGYKLI